MPHLQLVHKYPDVWPRVRVDRGAIRFVLSGAALMVPGLTSPGGRLPSGSYKPVEDESGGEVASGGVRGVPSGEGKSPGDEARYADQPDFPAGAVVIVEAEGKDVACEVGLLKMGTAEMREKKKGICIDAAHYLGDGLWKLKLD